MIHVNLKCLPIALKRPRFVQKDKRPVKTPVLTKKRKKVVVYDSQTKIKAGVALLMKSQYTGKPIDCYCKVKLDFHFVSYNNLELWNIERPTKTDLDNLVKFILDVGNNILWSDDRLITHIECRKIYSTENRILIEVTPMLNVKDDIPSEVFKNISPVQLRELIGDFNNMIFDMSSCEYENSDKLVAEKMQTTATGLLKFSYKWSSLFKKISSIKACQNDYK
jgi:Holliday junction resolvase RusA-like endonuclease